jgi:hypothetical protein
MVKSGLGGYSQLLTWYYYSAKLSIISSIGKSSCKPISTGHSQLAAHLHMYTIALGDMWGSADFTTSMRT